MTNWMPFVANILSGGFLVAAFLNWRQSRVWLAEAKRVLTETKAKHAEICATGEEMLRKLARHSTIDSLLASEGKEEKEPN